MIRYRCITCGEGVETDEVVYRCPKCSQAPQEGFQKGNLLVEMDWEKVQKPLPSQGLIDPFALLPGQFPIRECHEFFPAGGTPLSKLGSLAEGRVFQRLWAKQDFLNPSGSLKDRASLFVAAQAKYHGSNKVVLASTGNAGSAMSCAGAALGMEIILFVPASAPKEKLAQSLYYGAKVIPVDGTYDDAFSLSIEFSQEFGGINRNTAYNPMTVEGKKTVALEIFNQFGGQFPDLIYVPTGDGVIYSGLCKGIEDLYRLGFIDTMPRCVVVQAQGSNAISMSHKQGKEILLEKAMTLADSISVASPASGELALDYLKKTKGWCVELSDEQILQAQGDLARKTGNFVEPSCAVTWAGVQKDLEQGRITGEESILLLLTGSGFKDMSAVLGQIVLPEPVSADLDRVMAFLDQS